MKDNIVDQNLNEKCYSISFQNKKNSAFEICNSFGWELERIEGDIFHFISKGSVEGPIIQYSEEYASGIAMLTEQEVEKLSNHEMIRDIAELEEVEERDNCFDDMI